MRLRAFAACASIAASMICTRNAAAQTTPATNTLPPLPADTASPAPATNVSPPPAMESVNRAPSKKRPYQPHPAITRTGALVFAAGYGPAVATALPSTAGLVGRIFFGVFTLGIGPLNCAFNHPDTYWCRGDHGSVQLLLPVAGPLLFIDNDPKDTVINERGSPLSPFAKTALYASSAVQAAGLGILVTGMALGNSVGEDGSRDGGAGLRTAGGVLLASAYGGGLVLSVPSLLRELFWALDNCHGRYGGCPERSPSSGMALALPLAGPFLFMANDGRDPVLNPRGSLSPTARIVLAVDGAAQIAGFALLTAGLLSSPSKAHPSESEASASRWTPKLRVLPLLRPDTLGLAVTVE